MAFSMTDPSSWLGGFQDANVGIQTLLPGHGFDAKAAEDRQRAADQALGRQIDTTNAAKGYVESRTGLANDAAAAGTSAAADALRSYGGQGLDYLAGGRDASLDALGDARWRSLGDLRSGYLQGRADLGQVAGLQSYAPGAAQSINTYDLLGQRDSRLDNFMSGDMSGLGQDAGYKFRQQQGEDAINRAASASGGRFGGRTMQALAGFNQDLASQEADKYAQRAMASDQMGLSALANQAGRNDAAALAAQGNQMGLAQTGYGAQAGLANMAMGYGGQRAGIQQQYGRDVAGVHGQTSSQQADLAMGIGSGLSGLYSGLGNTQSGNIMTGAGMNTNLTLGLMPQYNNPVDSAGDKNQSFADQSRYGWSQLGPGNWFGMGGG